MPDKRLKYLLYQYLAKTCTASEKQELAEMVLTAQHDGDIQDFLAQAWDKITADLDMPDERAQGIIDSILRSTEHTKVYELPKRNKYIKLWRRWAVAASIVMALGIGSYFLFFNKTEKPIEIAKTPTVPNDMKAPETNKAIITLANGNQVYLDSVSNGQLAVQGNVKLVKLADGKIVYSSESVVGSQEMQYNTLSNPRGSKVIDMMLADGSHVWLNSGSSVTFPVAFVGDERRVSITGEAYLEVAHNSSMPFYVTKDEIAIQVLGTHFNVNTYDDEADIKVTLLEGSVKVIKGNSSGLLKPGQQAQVTTDIRIVNTVDVDEVMAWKNGKFQFGEKTDIGSIMRQIARWYDVDVVYDGAVPKQRFGGEMPRNSNLSQVLEILKTSGVKFSIEGRKVTIRP